MNQAPPAKKWPNNRAIAIREGWVYFMDTKTSCAVLYGPQEEVERIVKSPITNADWFGEIHCYHGTLPAIPEPEEAGAQ